MSLLVLTHLRCGVNLQHTPQDVLSSRSVFLHSHLLSALTVSWEQGPEDHRGCCLRAFVPWPGSLAVFTSGHLHCCLSFVKKEKKVGREHEVCLAWGQRGRCSKGLPTPAVIPLFCSSFVFPETPEFGILSRIVLQALSLSVVSSFLLISLGKKIANLHNYRTNSNQVRAHVSCYPM